MAKDRVIKPMTDEQRQRILDTPGVIVRSRKEPPQDPFFVPRFPAAEKLSITASELIDDDDDEWQDAAWSD